MKIIVKLYNLYLKHFPNLILLLIASSLILIFKNLPYINIVILNLDPIFSVIALMWFTYYFTNKPSTSTVLIISLGIIIIDCLLVLLRSMEIAEFIAPVSFLMIFTVAIKELLGFKGIIKKQPKIFNE